MIFPSVSKCFNHAVMSSAGSLSSTDAVCRQTQHPSTAAFVFSVYLENARQNLTACSNGTEPMPSVTCSKRLETASRRQCRGARNLLIISINSHLGCFTIVGEGLYGTVKYLITVSDNMVRRVVQFLARAQICAPGLLIEARSVALNSFSAVISFLSSTIKIMNIFRN